MPPVVRSNPSQSSLISSMNFCWLWILCLPIFPFTSLKNFPILGWHLVLKTVSSRVSQVDGAVFRAQTFDDKASLCVFSPFCRWCLLTDFCQVTLCLSTIKVKDQSSKCFKVCCSYQVMLIRLCGLVKPDFQTVIEEAIIFASEDFTELSTYFS